MINIVFFVMYTAIITTLSLLPSENIGNPSYNDKLAHCAAYCVFTVLAYRIKLPFKGFISLTIGIFIYSGLIEVAQSYTGRTMSLADLIANGLGIIIGLIGIYSLYRYRTTEKNL